MPGQFAVLAFGPNVRIPLGLSQGLGIELNALVGLVQLS
jgi:hypothetical protein